MKLASIVTAVFLCSTGCAARSVSSAQAVVPSHGANVRALVQEPVDPPATAVEDASPELAGLDLQIPESTFDFSLRDHASTLSVRSVAAPKGGVRAPDAFSFPGPDH